MPTTPIPFDPAGRALAIRIRVTGGQECNFQIAFFPQAGQRGTYLAELETTRGGESSEISIPEPPGGLDGDYVVWWLGPYGPDPDARYRIRVAFLQDGRTIHERLYRGTIAENRAGHVDDGRFATAPAS